MTKIKPYRIPLLAAAMLALLAALWAGLLRLGWDLPPLAGTLAAAHGPLMVAGFLGTLIGLERAVALGRWWAYAAPVLVAAGAALLLAGLALAGALLIAAGSLVLIAVFATIVRRQPEIFNMVMAVGALVWLAGNLLWLAGRPIFSVVPWWSGFLVLTIAGERLELGRLLNLSRAVRAAFVLAAACFLMGLAASVAALDAGVRIAGLGMIALALWLLRYDIARRTVRRAGLTRFIALCMISGYVWLLAGGVLGIAYGGVRAGPYYDAQLHAVFLGFVFAMIFGHAPIIFPAVLGIPVSFTPAAYAHLVLLHLSLALRLLGDIAGWGAARQWGGMLNAVVVLLFIASTVWSIRRSVAGVAPHRDAARARPF